MLHNLEVLETVPLRHHSITQETEPPVVRNEWGTGNLSQKWPHYNNLGPVKQQDHEPGLDTGPQRGASMKGQSLPHESRLEPGSDSPENLVLYQSH